MCATKISNNRTPKKPKNGASLDTSAQLTILHSCDGKDKLSKRRIAKAITLGQLFPLIDLDSDLKKSYWRTYYCNRTLNQEGHKFTTRYCNGRWCTVCNRIRMAKMITAYAKPIMDIKDLQFVTLTAPNVSGADLRSEIGRMYKNWRNINQSLRQTYGMNIKGIRKLECTYNPKTNTFNPHFHFLIGNKDHAVKLVELWLKKNPEASPKAQDIRKAKDGSIIELFKYAVKGINEGQYHAGAADQIYQSMYGKRTFQNFGIAKVVTEDVDGIQSENITFRGYREQDSWEWSKDCKDWVNSDGELLIDTLLNGDLIDWIEDLTKEIDGEIVEPEQEQNLIVLSDHQKEDVLWDNYTEMADWVINQDSS